MTDSAADRWLTFDCFGTLVRWQRGFPEILARIAGERAGELSRAYHPVEAELEAGPYQRYAQILRTGVSRAAASIGLALQPGDDDVLVRYWDEQPLWDDVPDALRAVRAAGWKTAALTNCDRDLFARTQARFPVPFDMVITAQDVGAYKPSPEHFKAFARLSGVDRDRWVHVACSWFHDIEPAARIGLKRVWIDRDRTGEDPHTATAVRKDLEDLPLVVEGL